jgi:hypothetical protein
MIVASIGNVVRGKIIAEISIFHPDHLDARAEKVNIWDDTLAVPQAAVGLLFPLGDERFWQLDGDAVGQNNDSGLPDSKNRVNGSIDLHSH